MCSLVSLRILSLMRRRLSGIKIQDDDFDTCSRFRLQAYAILTIGAVVNCQLRLVA